MTRVDHRKPPARAARKQHKAAERRSDSPPRRKAQRSRSAIGATVVGVAAILAVSAFILTRGPSSPPGADDGLRMGSGTDSGAAAPAQTSDANTTKADRKPPAGASAAPKPPAPKPQPTTSTPPSVNTGPISPAFKSGQWIAVLDKYPSDTGMDAAQAATNTAAKLTKAGIPAKAMLVNGQYPGLVNSSLERITDTWLVYLGPGTSSAQMLNICTDPRTQRAYPSPACPTYEPAAAPGG